MHTTPTAPAPATTYVPTRVPWRTAIAYALTGAAITALAGTLAIVGDARTTPDTTVAPCAMQYVPAHTRRDVCVSDSGELIHRDRDRATTTDAYHADTPAGLIPIRYTVRDRTDQGTVRTATTLY